MTVSSTISKVSYSGDDSTVSFPIPFNFTSNADIVAVLADADGNETTWTITTDYTLTGAGGTSGGTLTAFAAPSTGETLVIYRDPEIKQLVDYVENDPFSADTHEGALDKLTYICQALDEKVGRALLQPVTSSGSNVTFAPPDAGKVLLWNATGTAVTNGPDADQIARAQGYADDAEAARDAAQNEVEAAFMKRAQYFVDDYGAVGDGSTDDTAAIQAAYDACAAAGGGVVVLGPKVYAHASTLDFQADNVMVMGQGQGYNQNGVSPDYNTAATVLKWTGGADIQVDFGPASGATYAVKGGGIEGIFFHGGGVSTIGLKTRACYGSRFHRLTFSEHVTSNIQLETIEDLVTDPGTQQVCHYDIITCIQQPPRAGNCITFVGNDDWDASLNYFGSMELMHYNGNAIDMGSSDGNTFARTSIYRHPSGTGIGVLFRAGDSVANFCRKNTFVYLQTGAGGLYAQGTPSGTLPSADNVVLCYSRGNRSPLPTIAAGATLTYTTDTGVEYSPTKMQGTFTPTITYATPGDLSVSYALQQGRYQRRGNVVHVQISLTFTPTFTTASGDFIISGLPYTSSESGTANGTLAVNGTIGIAYGTSKTFIAGRVLPSTATAKLVGMGSGATNAFLTVGEVTSGAQRNLILSGSYEVA